MTSNRLNHQGTVRFIRSKFNTSQLTRQRVQMAFSDTYTHRYVCPASDKLLEVAGLSPSLGTKTMTAEQHFALANALARFKHRPDISAIEGY